MRFLSHLPDDAASGERVAIFPRHSELSGRLGRQRVALIGGFRPRQCGIATFTTDLYEQLQAHHPDIALDIYAVTPSSGERPSADEPDLRAIIEEQERDSYIAAANAINASGATVVWLQHEFGIFGGESGELALELVDRVAAPLIVTLHTTLANPSPRQAAIVDRIVAKASRIVVMSRQGRRLLIERHGADPDQISLIEHGAPDRPFGRQADFRARLGLDGRRIMMTFGLLGPGKGLETAIEALPAIVARHPDIVYRIVGATHPNLVRTEGERYRQSLQALADRLGVSDYIAWDNRFLDREELLDQLEACDIYLTPYLNAQQATSGTLAYAVALGKAVISTPYVHAQELLGDGTGMLVPAGDAGAIAEAANTLLSEPARLEGLQRAAYQRGRLTIWRHFADATAGLIRRTSTPADGRAPQAVPTQPLSFDAIRLMSDGTGMLQHGIGIVPDRRHGYCLDDNARALMLMNRLDTMPEAERLGYAVTYASFVQHSWNADRQGFRNFMAYDRQWCEDLGSEDSNGRAIWTLGDTALRGMNADLRAWAGDWFARTAPIALRFEAPRATAFAMLGAADALAADVERSLCREILERGGALLMALLDARYRPDWTWFEAWLSYDNPRLSEALIRGGVALGRQDWIGCGLESLAWICGQQVGSNGLFRPVGSDGFGREFDFLPFDQQPLEGWAAIDACAAAASVDKDNYAWREHAMLAWGWYMGRNDRARPMGDVATGFCRDGVTSRGVNDNRGAESLLAFQLAYYGLMDLVKRQDRAPDAGTNGGTLRDDGLRRHTS